MKNSIEESMRMEKEAAAILRAMEKAVTEQEPVPLQDPGAFRDRMEELGSGLPQAGMTLLKIRVFIRTMQGIEQRSARLGEKLEEIRDRIQREASDVPEQEAASQRPSPAGPFSGPPPATGLDREAASLRPSPAGTLPDPLSALGLDREAVSQRLFSLSVTRKSLRQTEIQAHQLAAAYGELERAAAEAGKAADAGRRIRLAKAAERLRESLAGIAGAEETA